MEYTTLGDTGTTVSKICLGCMSFGDNDWREWVLDEEAGRELVDRAIELGVNFFDTANIYSLGGSERVLGDALSAYDRDEFVVASKVYFQMDDDDPNSGGLSRKAIEQELDNSLDRLGLDTLDLVQIHRWDDDTPIERTMRALDAAVDRGKARYLGASSMWAHQFAEAQHVADREGLTPFSTMQNHYNLLYREEEREMLPLCDKQDVGVIPWSPLARGRLARPHEEAEATTRGETDDYAFEHPYLEGGGREVNERVQELAAEKGVKMAQIGLAWLLHQDAVDAPVVAARKPEYVVDAVVALDIDLSDSDLVCLPPPYQPLPAPAHA